MFYNSSLSGPPTFVGASGKFTGSYEEARQPPARKLGKGRLFKSQQLGMGGRLPGPGRGGRFPLSIPLRGQKKVKAKELLLAKAGLCGLCSRSRGQGAPRLVSLGVPGPPSPAGSPRARLLAPPGPRPTFYRGPPSRRRERGPGRRAEAAPPGALT